MTYIERSRRSADHLRRATDVVAGGISRQTVVFPPYPPYLARGSGCYVTDVDGNEYLDLVNNYTSLIHGHAHPATTAAIADAAASGTALGSASPLELPFAQRLRERFASFERLRLATSGTEAVTLALRMARAHTGRTTIVKFEGGFHGAGDEVSGSIATQEPLQPGAYRRIEPNGAGLLPVDTLVCRYGDEDSVRAVFEAHGETIAALIMEPYLGNNGLLAATAPFVRAVRELTTTWGALFIADEIQSTRNTFGGLEVSHGVRPDLTTTGKIIGGGLPIAAVGGRADVLGHLGTSADSVRQTGTFVGFGLALAAGIATLDAFDQAEMARLNDLATSARLVLTEALRNADVEGVVVGQGSMLAVLFVPSAPHFLDELADNDVELWEAVHLELLGRGVYITRRGIGSLSTPMTEVEVGLLGERFADALQAAKRA